MQEVLDKKKNVAAAAVDVVDVVAVARGDREKEREATYSHQYF